MTKEVTYGKNEEKKSSTTFTQTIDGVIYLFYAIHYADLPTLFQARKMKAYMQKNLLSDSKVLFKVACFQVFFSSNIRIVIIIASTASIKAANLSLFIVKLHSMIL